MKPNKCVGLRCRLTQPTENEQGIVYSINFLFHEYDLAALACIFRKYLLLNLVIKFAENENELSSDSSIFY